MPPKSQPKKSASTPAAKPAAKPQQKKAAAQPAKAAAPAAPAKKAASGSVGNAVYVKGLGNSSVADVKNIFANVADVRLRRNKFALVSFDSSANAEKAIKSFNGKTVGGNSLSVVAARSSPVKAKAAPVTVFVSPIFRQMTTRTQVRKLFEGQKITKLRLYKKNCAFVRFDSAAAAASAIKNVNGKQFYNKTLTVKSSVRK